LRKKLVFDEEELPALEESNRDYGSLNLANKAQGDNIVNV